MNNGIPHIPYREAGISKPPIGVVPRFIWLECRAKDLAVAISDQLSCAKPNYENILAWSNELLNITYELNNVNHEKEE